MGANEDLAAVVAREDAQSAIAALRSEGVYDDDRQVRPLGEDDIAIPVTEAPRRTTVRRVVRTPGDPRLRTLADHLRQRGWTDEEIDRAPASWAQLGTVVLVDVGETPRPAEVGEALLALHGGADTVLDRGPVRGEHREPEVDVLAGEGDTETVHVEHGTTYAMDLAEVMFSPGNKAERARMGDVVAPDERVLDMFAGIGYFALPMARAGAAVTAVERNPTAFEYLLENVIRNEVTDAVCTYRADCRDVVDSREGTDFDRVVMGHYEAHEYLEGALSALAPGGRLHMHEATPSALVPDRPVERLQEAAARAKRDVDVRETRYVKGYAEGVSHVVVDAVLDP
ncbi:MAG: class I SAM-dependent methyltransferase family protein [Haloarculaceae archaeon]